MTVVNKIAEALNESNDEARRQIELIVGAVGEGAALEVLEETERIEQAGGELVARGDRRRTPGGVFFRLVRARLSKEQKRAIFRPDKPPRRPAPPAPRAAAPAPKASRAPATKRSPPGRPRPHATERREVTVETRRPRRRIVTPAGPDPSSGPTGRVVSPPAAAVNAGQGGPVPGTLQQRLRLVSRDELPKRAAAPPTPVNPAGSVAAAAVVEPGDAKQRVRDAVRGLSGEDARRTLFEVLAEFGGAPFAAAARRRDEPPPESEEAPILSGESEEALRERLLAAVAARLELSPEDLAAQLYGSVDSESLLRAQVLLDRQRDR